MGYLLGIDVGSTTVKAVLPTVHWIFIIRDMSGIMPVCRRCCSKSCEI